MVNMRKFLIAPILSVVMVATVVLGVSFVMKPDSAVAEPVAIAQSCDTTSVLGVICARQENGQIIISVAGSDVATLPIGDVVNPPTVTVGLPSTIRVTLPRVTVTRPVRTVTLPRVTVPRGTLPRQTVTLPRQTVTIKLPQTTATATASVRLPGQTSTVPGQSVATVTMTGPDGQPIQTSVTITPSPLPGTVTTKPVVRERQVRVSVPTAIGIGVGVLLLGLILGLLAIYTAYAVGYKDSEDAETTRWQNFRDELFGKKDEGDK